MKIDFKSRMNNGVFWYQIIIAITTTVLAYAGLTMQDITTWSKLFDLAKSAVTNPYVLFLICQNVINITIDSKTKGIGD